MFTTLLNILKRPGKIVDAFLNDKPAKDLKAEVERKRTERDRELEEKLK